LAHRPGAPLSSDSEAICCGSLESEEEEDTETLLRRGVTLLCLGCG